MKYGMYGEETGNGGNDGHAFHVYVQKHGTKGWGRVGGYDDGGVRFVGIMVNKEDAYRFPTRKAAEAAAKRFKAKAPAYEYSVRRAA